MESSLIRAKFLKFFENRGHKILPSSSLIPTDPSVLFTTAGMQQFKPYYTSPESADKDFGGRNIVTAQKCIRTGDIDEVGDATHLTFFEMLGNFSFGGYGKREAITYAYDFITKELGLEISYVTVLGDVVPFADDQESIDIWKELGIPPEKIIKQGIDDVFWGPTGDSGPCGPTTEIYCKNADGADVEIWNIVFNQYFSKTSREQAYTSGWQLEDLKIFGIDTGMGLERLLATVEKKKNVYETDLFNNEQTKEERIVADHVKAALFMISDGIVPSNTGAGYVLRRLIRRAVRFSKTSLREKVENIKKVYEGAYNLDDKGEIEKEEKKFKETLERGLKEFKNVNRVETYVNGKLEDKILRPDIVFTLYTSYGFPIELIEEEAKKIGLGIDLVAFEQDIKQHQEKSRTSSAGMFKGGLVDHKEKTIKHHTAHHLLLAALQNVVGPEVKQRGSNITEERLRIDFLCDHKLTPEEKDKVEGWVNDKIKQRLQVVCREMPFEEAQKIGAEMEFGAKYADIVSVYFIEDGQGNIFSKEFCGGPHVANTGELSVFKIQKEEAVSQGVRRIKAALL